MDKQLGVKISDNNFERLFDDLVIIFKFIRTKSQILVRSLNTKNLVVYKIKSALRPVFTNKKIADDIKVAEAKPQALLKRGSRVRVKGKGHVSRKQRFLLCFPGWLKWETYVSDAKFVSGKQKFF